jgi:3-isopropylmalate dehydrogenase
MEMNIALLPGDGIGPEVIAQAVKVVKAVGKKFGHTIHFEEAPVGAAAIDQVGDPYPDATHEVCLRADAVLFGAIGHPKYDNDPKAKVRPEQGLLRMRQKLGLFANVRPTFTFPSLIHKSPLKLGQGRGSGFRFFQGIDRRDLLWRAERKK